MPDKSDLASPGATLELLQNQAASSRRARPPNLDIGSGAADRVPLRAEADSKLRRRESRLGLRSIFGWGKNTASADKAAAPLSPAAEVPQRHGGIRASLAEINWPYSLPGQGQRSEVALPSFSNSDPDLKHRKSASVVRGQALPISARGSLATWDPPPLFKAYPQAVKHAHLPACTASAETVLRLHGHRSSISQISLTLDATEDSGLEKNDKPKRKHRRNASGSSLKVDWTTKVFVLVTSGYLLQYAGDGSFDRLPEKVLHLGKDSAAFASDVIPGRHWVLQVSSVVEPDRTMPSHANFLLSRLAFRGQERRQASNLLMVFEGAEDMDSWITTLRREIEALGGRKYLSETGKPKVDEIDNQLRSQTSQRTLVVKDPDRFSRIISPDLPWERNSPTSMGSPDIHLDLAESDMARDQSFDDTSTASGVSHDGRQLDGLRDSTNRLSFISSGQRTVITSAGSSPACSPVRDSFASQDDGHIPDLHLHEEPSSRPRPRPNASAINDRRQSMQAMNHLFEIRVSSAQIHRPHSTYSNAWQPELSQPLHSAPQTIPNFSVPQSMGKRYSITRPPPTESAQTWGPIPSRMSSMNSMGSRRPPPTALSINPRPLSLVEDQPSPLSTPMSRDDPLSSTAPDTPSMFSSWAQHMESERRGSQASVASIPKATVVHGVVHNSHQRYPSASSIRSSDRAGPATGRPETPVFILPDKVPPPIPFSPPAITPQDIPRPKSSLDYYARNMSPTPLATRQALRNRRLSLYTQDAEKPIFNPCDIPRRSRTPSLKPVPRSSQHLRVESVNQGLLQRRSLSQLAEGPPPGPPPNRALPPIPRKLSRASVAQPSGFRP
ncbi:hypothetical protein B0H67DRAFT_489127 [Lasiosphaeris hirsuta]|uniref:PH domain-containing protein n=1 Tax=Lasiosphaeris hirsuta TaxID=260670 RepID=A0AA40AFL6_9PEZI|nr:hypothetical protein B0H67DRAFT_489127 [Lasiosphaeris hirsuta]